MPLLISVPWLPQSMGRSTLALAELVDMFPTLAELAGFSPVLPGERLEGVSLLPVIKNPDSIAGWKNASFSQVGVRKSRRACRWRAHCHAGVLSHPLLSRSTPAA